MPPLARRIAVLAGVVVIVALTTAPTTGGASPGVLARSSAPLPRAARVVIVTVDATTLSEWASAELPTFRALLRDGATGLLASRTGVPVREPFEIRRSSAYASLGAGRPVRDTTPACEGPCRPQATVLARAVSAAGRTVALLSGIRPAPAARALDRAPAAQPDAGFSTPDRRFPTGRRTDFGALLAQLNLRLPGTAVLLADTADTARVDAALGEDEAARAPWTRLALLRTDRFLAGVRRSLGPDDLLIVTSLVAPVARAHGGRYLTPVLVHGAGTPRGLLTSETTRRRGVVAIGDLLPTALAGLGIAIPAGPVGRPLSVSPDANPLADAAALERAFGVASDARRPLTRGLLGLAALAIAGSLVLVLRGRGAPPGTGRAPSGIRDGLAVVLLAVCGVPLATLVAAALPLQAWTHAALVVTLLALGMAAAARAAAGRELGLAAVTAATVGVILADVALGTPLASRSALSFLPALGARFWGIGNELMGVAIGSAVVAAALVLDRGRRSPRTLGVVVAALAGVVLLMGAPWVGGKFGAALTAAPAFGTFLVVARRGRLDARTLLLVAIVTVLLADLAILADAARPPESQSHLGRAVTGEVDLGPVLVRKLEAARAILFVTVWPLALLFFGGAVAVLARRRRSILGRALWGRPHLRGALWSTAVGAPVAVLVNDAGVIAAALMAMVVVSSLFVVLLGADAGVPEADAPTTAAGDGAGA